MFSYVATLRCDSVRPESFALPFKSAGDIVSTAKLSGPCVRRLQFDTDCRSDHHDFRLLEKNSFLP